MQSVSSQSAFDATIQAGAHVDAIYVHVNNTGAAH